MDLETYPPVIDAEMQALPTYNRKEKSLGLLCENFLSLYGAEEETECISLDEAATRLGVERRRIYDIVNILESVEVLVRKAKNCYVWYGFTRLPQALKEMKQAALREYGMEGLSKDALDGAHQEDASAFGTQESVNRSGNRDEPHDDPYGCYKPKTKADCRREKSLGLLSQKFVQLFLVSQSQVVSLDEAAKILFGGCTDPSKLKTKVRRLYDIANVLTSLQLIEKTHGAESRKPAFKWLGVRENGVPLRKRQFGSCRPNSADPPSNSVKRQAIRRGAVSVEQTGKPYSLKPLQPKFAASFGGTSSAVYGHAAAAADGVSVFEASSSLAAGLPFSMHFGSWDRACVGRGSAGCSLNDGKNTPWAAGHSCSLLPSAHAQCTCSLKAMHDSVELLSRYPVNILCPCHLMQEVGAGSGEGGGFRCPAHLGMAAAMQYQNESLNNMFSHYVDYWRNVYFQGQQRPFDPASQASCDSTCNK